jgi:glycosyltransferase involved in cell wall biosynthesis
VSDIEAGTVPLLATVVDVPGVLVVYHSSKLIGTELVLLDIVRGFGMDSSPFLFEESPLCCALAERRFLMAVSQRASSFAGVKRDRTLALAVPQASGLAVVVTEIRSRARQHRLRSANSQKAFVLSALAMFLAQRRLVIMLANQLVACVIAQSTAVTAAFTRAGGRASLVRVVLNGLDIVLKTADRAELRASLSLPDGFLFGMFSWLAPWKERHGALEASARLPQARCLIASAALFGEDAYAQAPCDRAVRLDVVDRVLFVGHRNDVSRLMHAVVHPSADPAPFGRTLVEAMLCRRPVIAASDGAASEILDEGRAGFLMPPGNTEALADKLRSIMTGGQAIEAIVDIPEHRAGLLYSAPRIATENTGRGGVTGEGPIMTHVNLFSGWFPEQKGGAENILCNLFESLAEEGVTVRGVVPCCDDVKRETGGMIHGSRHTTGHRLGVRSRFATPPPIASWRGRLISLPRILHCTACHSPAASQVFHL